MLFCSAFVLSFWVKNTSVQSKIYVGFNNELVTWTNRDPVCSVCGHVFCMADNSANSDFEYDQYVGMCSAELHMWSATIQWYILLNYCIRL